MGVLSPVVKLSEQFVINLPDSQSRSIAKLFKRITGVLSRIYSKIMFVRQASGINGDTKTFRKDIIRRFSFIHKKIRCAHQESELLILANEILSLQIDGPLVELGCFKGGSTAKLSLIAKHSGRKLYVCDTFEGLPNPSTYDQFHAFTTGGGKSYNQGDYCGNLAEVKGSIEKYGAIEACEFVKGYFADTLPTLNLQPTFIFMDADLIDSARDCLKNLWPKLKAGGKFFTHEATMLDFMNGLLDVNWWRQYIGDAPPTLFGAGYGLGPDAQNLAYFKKP